MRKARSVEGEAAGAIADVEERMRRKGIPDYMCERMMAQRAMLMRAAARLRLTGFGEQEVMRLTQDVDETVERDKAMEVQQATLSGGWQVVPVCKWRWVAPDAVDDVEEAMQSVRERIESGMRADSAKYAHAMYALRKAEEALYGDETFYLSRGFSQRTLITFARMIRQLV